MRCLISSDPRRRAAGLIAISLFLVTSIPLIGCNSTSQTDSGDGAAATEEPSPDATAESNEPKPREAEIVTHRDGTKWIGGIPYDVYFDRPLEEYRDQTLVASTANGADPEMVDPGAESAADDNGDETSDPPTDDPSEVASGSDEIDWAALAPLEVLFEEATDVRNRLNGNLQTVATYNRELILVVNDGNVLATLGAVIEKHPGEGSWKENARFIRYLGYEIYLNGGTSGRSNFEATKEPFEQALTVMSGGATPEVEVEEEFYFPDVADRAELMKYIETNFGWLRSNINTETRLKEEKEQAFRTATIMAVFGQVLTSEDYDSADDPEYQAFLEDFIEGNRAAAQAVEAENFSELEAAISRVNNTCAPCHQKFQSKDGDF